MELVHRDRVLGGARLRMEAARRLEDAVDQRRRHADAFEIAEALIGEGLVELPGQRLVAGAREVDDRETVVAHAPYLSARKGNAKADGCRPIRDAATGQPGVRGALHSSWMNGISRSISTKPSAAHIRCDGSLCHRILTLTLRPRLACSASTAEMMARPSRSLRASGRS